MIISMIVAHDPNLLIGAEGGLPWHYKEDLQFFKKTTLGCPIVMGRKVFQEVGEKPLPGRRNMVITKTKSYKNVEVFDSPEIALNQLDADGTDHVFIIGGRSLYEQYLTQCDHLYVTEVKKAYDGDTWFPEYKHLIGTHFRQVLLEETNELTFYRYDKTI